MTTHRTGGFKSQPKTCTDKTKSTLPALSVSSRESADVVIGDRLWYY